MKNRLFVNNLTTLDFSYLHPTRGIVGETWIVDIELYGELDDQGMLFDFGDVKKSMKQAAEDLIDHKLAVSEELPGLTIERHAGQITMAYQVPGLGRVHMEAPEDALAVIPGESLSLEDFQPYLAEHLASVVPDNVHRVDVELRVEDIHGAYYHYSHGLKKHVGNCQRIAHGHRSRLEIYADGQRSQLTEYQWAKRWKDVYIGTRQDVVSEYERDGIAYLDFAYQASQGSFRLTLPRKAVYLIDADSTVECIAEHIVLTLQKQRPQNRFRVRAFEGLHKGAISEV